MASEGRGRNRLTWCAQPVVSHQALPIFTRSPSSSSSSLPQLPSVGATVPLPGPAMDPASALGTTSAVLSFLSCVGKTISVARQLSNAKETPLEFQRLHKLSAGVHSGLDKLKHALTNKNPNNFSASESSLVDVLEQCVTLEARICLAARWVEKPDAIAGASVADKAKDDVRYWVNVSAASLRIVLKKPDFDDLKHEFHRCTTLLNTHLTEILR